MAAALARACFAAGTKLWTPDGYQAIETIQAGDLVFSRHEDDPQGPIEPKVVEEVFVRFGRLVELTVAGRVILTTGEHSPYDSRRGWVEAKDLLPGDTGAESRAAMAAGRFARRYRRITNRVQFACGGVPHVFCGK